MRLGHDRDSKQYHYNHDGYQRSFLYWSPRLRIIYHADESKEKRYLRR
jgi:hypothetical protein